MLSRLKAQGLRQWALWFLVLLLTSCKITGEVSQDGVALENRLVSLEKIDASFSNRRTTRTDSQGRYKFDDVDAGRYRITVESGTTFSRAVSRTVAKIINKETQPIISSKMASFCFKKTVLILANIKLTSLIKFIMFLFCSHFFHDLSSSKRTKYELNDLTNSN